MSNIRGFPGRSESPVFDSRPRERMRQAERWKTILLGATVLSVLFLVALLSSVIDKAFGYALIEYEVDPASLSADGSGIEVLAAPALAQILEDQVTPRRLRVLGSTSPISGRSKEDLLALIETEVLKPHVVDTWGLAASIFDKASIARAAAENPQAKLVFRSWVNPGLLASGSSADPLKAGLKGALLGSVLTVALAILFALPLGIAAAIWLEEYAADTKLNRVLRTNIYNLAGVPSIVYGMLGLALFVRAMEPLTSGALFSPGGAVDGANGRTVLSAALTLATLVLPIVIINAQEALRAVPASIREASLALGATRWQTIWHQVLPATSDRLLSGAVLALSRALGETAPLVVVGASTFLSIDPSGLFSKFTTLPLQIYQWTARPQKEFRNLAAAAILVLVVLLVSLNAFAIIARNNLRKRREA